MTDQKDTHNARIIAIGNQKGGVAKSTNTVNLAAALGEAGHKCLVVDLDANCGATRALGVPTKWMGSFEVLLGTEPIDELIITTDPQEGTSLPKNVDLLPGNRMLEDFDEVFRQRNKFVSSIDTLADPLASIQDQYDFILLDTAPNANSPTIAAYKCAHWFILSTKPDKISMEAMGDALQDIIAVRERGNSGLRLLGVVLSEAQARTRIAGHYIEQVKRDFENVGESNAFAATVSRAVIVPESYEAGQSLFEFAPEHKVTDQYRELCSLVLARVLGNDGQKAVGEIESKGGVELKEASGA